MTDVDGSAQHVLRDLQIVLERAQRRHVALGQRIVVGAHRVRRPDLAVDHALHQGDQGERVLGQVDLAPEQHEPRAAALRGREQLESIARRAGATAEDPDDDGRIVRDQLLERLRAIVGDLQELRPAGSGTAASTRTMLSLTNSPISARLSRSLPTFGLNTSRKCLKPQRSASMRNSR